MQDLKTVALLCAALACVAYAAEEPPAPAQYDFAYAVNDPVTGDQKDQQETRNGDDVTGYYRTLDSDGFVRTVKYRADAVNGFTAEVIREPTGADVPVVAKAVVKPVAAVPVVARAPYVPAAPVAAAAAPFYYGGSSAYPYNYQPYSYGYQPYPYAAYTPYSYGQYPYSGQYPSFNSLQYTAPVVRK